jgi:UDP-3-O-[3-hydroxymyristoyl] N-acetylglucosamine deacetylase
MKLTSLQNTRKQNTLGKPISFSGIGIHTGVNVSMQFLPAEVGTGIVFQRTDIAGRPKVPATIEYVVETSRSTTLGLSDIRIHTVEHVLAALKAYQIDNLIIELSSFEPPVGNGSSDVFVQMIEEAKVVQQERVVPILSLTHPVFVSTDEIHMVALPSDTFQISYTLSYPKSKLLKSQYFSLQLTAETFKKEIASCRTFAHYEEISALIDRGLIKGGSLDNAVIIKDDVVLSKNGLFFSDEMVRHKILDVVGDLSLIGVDFTAHVIAIRSGHETNVALAKKIYETLTVGTTR